MPLDVRVATTVVPGAAPSGKLAGVVEGEVDALAADCGTPARPCAPLHATNTAAAAAIARRDVRCTHTRDRAVIWNSTA